VLLPCHQGASEAIGRFYKAVMGARVERGVGGQVEVGVGVGTRLIFKEVKSLGQRSEAVRLGAGGGWFWSRGGSGAGAAAGWVLCVCFA